MPKCLCFSPFASGVVRFALSAFSDGNENARDHDFFDEVIECVVREATLSAAFVALNTFVVFVESPDVSETSTLVTDRSFSTSPSCVNSPHFLADVEFRVDNYLELRDV